MKKISKKHLMIIGLPWAACLLMLLVIYATVLAPQIKYRKHMENQLAEKEQFYNLALEAAQDKTKTRLRAQISELQNRLQDFAIDFADAANLTFDISQIAGRKNVEAFSIKVKDGGTDAAKSDLNYLDQRHIDISFIGNFNQFATFVNALERHRPVVFVDSFKINRSRKNDSQHKVDMSLSAFVRKQQNS